MKTSGIEEFKAALRRSAWLIAGLIVLGAVAMNVAKQLAGPEYQAGARVILNNDTSAAAFLGISLPYTDPARQDEFEQNLANSPQLYDYAARRAGGRWGTGGELQAATSASVTNNVVGFTSSTSSAGRSLGIVNAVATAYPSWHAAIEGQYIDKAIAETNRQIARSGKTPALETRLSTLQSARALAAGGVLLVEKATGATKTTPRPVRDSLLGAAIGLVIALLVVGARELLDTRVRTEADVEEALEAPVLATIESLPRRLRSSVVDGRDGHFSDSYELLAANVAQIFDGAPRPVHLAITSAMPGEGKTTTAANLASALARRGAHVVVADFDLRKPALSTFFSIPRSAAGVHELLSGVVGMPSALWRVPLNGNGSQLAVAYEGPEPALAKTGAKTAGGTSEGTLTVVPGGMAGKSQQPHRFARLPALMEQLPPDADFVIIDTPPALLVAGVAELAQSVEAVIVVVRQGVVSRRRLRLLGRQSRSWRARLLGAILNDSTPEEGYSHHRYYGSS